MVTLHSGHLVQKPSCIIPVTKSLKGVLYSINPGHYQNEQLAIYGFGTFQGHCWQAWIHPVLGCFFKTD